MSMPNPQKEQIGIIHSANVLRSYTGRDLDPYLYGHEVTEETTYKMDDMPVICLGIYPDLQAAVFGEWQGPPDQQPIVAPQYIKHCLEAFLVRTTTAEEQVLHGGRQVVVLLRISEFTLSECSDIEEMFFTPTDQVGFYNPVG